MLAFFLILNRKDFTVGKFSKSISRELLRIGLPIVPVFIVYWIYNSMDRIMIAKMLGTGELGIYSIGSKFAHISILIYSAFAGGWQYFAFSTMKDSDQIELTTNIFEYLVAISFASLFCLYPFIKTLFTLLFPAKYMKGYTAVPYLYLAPLLLMLFQSDGNQFLVVKKSYLSTMTLALGAGINVLLNWLLIPIGTEGAVHVEEHDKYDAEVFLKFLQNVVALYPKGNIVMVLDNARIHHAKLLDDFLAENKNRLTLVFLPPYSLDYNMIEELWGWMKTSVINNCFSAPC